MKKIVFMMILLMMSSFVYASYYIGAKSESYWQTDPDTGSPWKGRFRGNDVCGNWYNTIDDNSSVIKKSWTTLRSPAKSRYETNGDQNTTYGLDGMDIFLHCGHSGLTDSDDDARWNMWEVDSLALASNMRLGDEALELKLFSTYGCLQLNNDDGNRWSRWRLVFRGGLKYVTGFHGKAYLNGTATQKNKDVGIDYANYLNTSTKKIKYAWWDAVKSFDDNTPAVMVTGSDSSNAATRRDYCRMNTLQTYNVYRDGDIGANGWTEWR
jgi:hypothetical protein